MDIYVGNLSYNLTEEVVRKAFEVHGKVESVKLITDRETGKVKGFGFITMPDTTEAQAAIDGLNSTELDGRPIKVNEARPREYKQ